MSNVESLQRSPQWSLLHQERYLFTHIVDAVTLHPDGSQEESQHGISPRMLKTLIGKGHAEFAGVKQQDAQEFLIWLLSRIQREGKATGHVEQNLISAEKNAMDDDRSGQYVDPTKVFKFDVQQRIQCLGCGGVKYRVDEQDNFNIPVPDKLKRYLSAKS
jgi:ubiquitin carboxyl-terminal hydrolase 5/13